jgi:tRNA pseudouridine55 synthase
VELAERPITVYRADVIWQEQERAAFEIECSTGTYVRSLITALGDAYCERLERTAIGPFRLADADDGTLVPIGDALAFLPERRLDEREADAVRHGRRVPRGPADAGPLRLEAGGELLAVGELRDEEIQPVVVFAPA